MKSLLLALLSWLLVAAAPDEGRFVEFDAPSSNVAPTHITVWLPPGYDAGKRRYPVVYMHDGQNLFFRKRSNFDKVWAADKSALRLIAAKKVAPFIIVGIDQPGVARYRQYFPQRLRADAPPAVGKAIDRAAGGPLTGDGYLRFLTEELKPRVDREYRTLPDPRHTAVVGSSMGGLISCYAIIERPDIFGGGGCVSTHWPLAEPKEFGVEEVSALWSRYLDAKLGKPAGRRIWMDHGDKTLDAFYPPYQARITADFKRLGWREGRDFVARAYPGAEHEENAWAARMDDIFGWLMR